MNGEVCPWKARLTICPVAPRRAGQDFEATVQSAMMTSPVSRSMGTRPIDVITQSPRPTPRMMFAPPMKAATKLVAGWL
jgi:hypothetical protein